MKQITAGCKALSISLFIVALSLQISGCANDPAAPVIGTYTKIRSSSETEELSLKSNNDFTMKTIRSGGDPTTVLAGKYQFNAGKVTLESVTHYNGHVISGEQQQDLTKALSEIPLNLHGSKLISIDGDFNKK
jgi:hypothetical protein